MTEHATVSEITEHLLEFDKEQDGVEFSTTAFFIPVDSDCCMEYLHRDGEIRTGTSSGEALARLLEGADHAFNTEEDIWNMYTGYFATREEAEAVRETYNNQHITNEHNQT